MIRLLVVMFLLLSLFAKAQEKDCLNSSDVARIRNRFSIHLEDHEDLCDSQSKTRRVIEALLFAERLQFTSQDHEPFWNQKILPSNWLDYLADLSPTIRACPAEPNLEKKGADGKSEPPTLAFVITGKAKFIFLCDALLDAKAGATTSDILTAMLHESRHHQGFKHVTCTGGTKKGFEGGCDPNYSFKGSYAVSLESNLKLGMLAANVHPALKELSLFSALDFAQNSFNELPEIMEMVTLLQNDAGEFYRFDGNALQPIPSLAPSPVHIAPLAAFGVRLLQKDGQQPTASLNSLDGVNFTKSDGKNDGFSPYDKAPVEVRKLFQDLMGIEPTYTVIAGGYVMGVVLDNNHYKNFKIALPAGKAMRVYRPSELPNAEANALYVQNDRDQLFKVLFFENSKTDIAEVEHPFRGYEAVIKLNGKLALLDHNGRLFVQDKNGTRTVPGSENSRFIEMSRPFQVIAN